MVHGFLHSVVINPNERTFGAWDLGLMIPVSDLIPLVFLQTPIRLHRNISPNFCYFDCSSATILGFYSQGDFLSYVFYTGSLSDRCTRNRSSKFVELPFYKRCFTRISL